MARQGKDKTVGSVPDGAALGAASSDRRRGAPRLTKGSGRTGLVRPAAQLAASTAPTPEAVLDYFALDAGKRIFSVGHGERRITMLSQQVRVLNLSHAMIQRGLAGPGARVLIVGAGLAGLTAAAAMTSADADVVVMEATGGVMSVQSGSHNRVVHPNIFDWPARPAFAMATSLPFLNWRAGSADSVARAVRAAFEPFADQCDVQVQRLVTAVVPDGDGVLVTSRRSGPIARGKRVERYDAVILTVGFGVERDLAGVPVMSYWRDEPLHQVDMTNAKRIKAAVVGAGDGGVTDTLRLGMRNFAHDTVLSSVGAHPEAIAMGWTLVELDREAAASPMGAGAFLDQEYAKLTVPDAVSRLICSDLRTDTAVTLFEASGSPFQLSSSPLNRLLVKALRDSGHITFEGRPMTPGDIAAFDTIVPRIGPHNALAPLLNEHLVLKAHDPEMSTLLSTTFLWSTASFRRGATPRPRLKVCVLLNTADRHNRDLIDRIRVGALEHNRLARGAYLSMSDRRIDTGRLEDPVYRRELLDMLAREDFDVMIVPSSDVARFASELAGRCRKMILCCEATTLNAVAPGVEAVLGADNVCLIPQVLDLAFMLRVIKLGFAGRRMCYIHSDACPVDGLYYQLLNGGLADQGDGLGGVELFEHRCEVFDLASLPKADAYTGRYFVHAQGPGAMIGELPFISGYATDLDAGAIAVLDINDAESGQRLVEGALTPIAFGYPPPQRVIEVQDMFLGLNLAQAARFGFDLPRELISLATNVLE